jgi:DNA-binding GntR family transcriptional regulator
MLEPFARTYVTAMVPGADLVWLGDRHSAIVEALEAGDADLAGSVMKQHASEARALLGDLEPDGEPMVAIGGETTGRD